MMAKSLADADVEQIHAIMIGIYDAQLAALNAARTFRTILVVATVALALGAAVFSIAASRTDPSLVKLVSNASPSPTPAGPSESVAPSGSGVGPTPFQTLTATPRSKPAQTPAATVAPTSAPTPTASASVSPSATPPADPENSGSGGSNVKQLLTLQLWGMVGGLIGAIPAMWNIRGSAGPVGLQLAQLAVKIPTGAWTGLVGVMMLQAEIIPSIQVPPDHSLAAYAILFGAGQQALTRFVDQRAGSVLDKTKTPGENAVS